ncbi:MAG TPA: haloacid dehalogenase-like hydrolase [Actinomycetota bacterium]|nr:haloacid dehalogenase-like hydrolase [Actinomycetota bacterium]
MGDRRLILWDIDGTLVRWGPVGRSVFDRAVHDVTGIDPDGHGVSMGGKTDPQIALEIMRTMDVPDEEAERVLPRVLVQLERETADAFEEFRATGSAHAGVADVLARLAETPGVVQTVLTGNIAPNMRVKLAVFGLDEWLDLDIAATGSDSADRRRLVPIAMERAANERGQQFEPNDVWVVGDTPRDLECARVAGARCALVATGRDDYAELAGLGADALFEDLSDVGSVVALLSPSADDLAG